MARQHEEEMTRKHPAAAQAGVGGAPTGPTGSMQMSPWAACK